MSMKARWIVLAGLIAAVLVVTVGFAMARQYPGASRWAGGDMAAACEAMHRSPAMERMHAQMPARLREQCNAMHAHMGQMMEQMGGMMTGGMMTGGMTSVTAGTEMMGSGIAAHHDTSGGGSR
jgi:hypothetical protein